MEIESLRKFENRKCRISLRNGFIYNHIIFIINDEGLIEFKDRYGELISCEPDFIKMISVIGTERRGDNEKERMV